jgi:hypothetical protein
MKDLLKEAIADAKAVRETALANAKLALEEAFTPRIQSMISAKLAEEMEEDEVEDEAPVEEPVETDTEDGAVETEEPEMDEPEMDDESEDDDLDLDEIISELESEDEMGSLSEYESEDEMTEAADEDEMMEADDEEVDLDEIVRSLREEEGAEDEMHEEETEDHSEELEEAYNVIRFLKGKINEVNLLNAKLLYSNKLFRNFSLNENQKMKVIESFDRSSTLREVKLVYSTLAESFKMPSVNRKPIKESFASKPIASTKPAKQVITEGTELANRFKKLAGLK